MPSSTSNSERLTAADRPGVAQPVPLRPVPSRPWPIMAGVAFVLLLAFTSLWEWHARALGLQPGDYTDGPTAWAEQRRRIDAGDVQVAIVGDSRILYDTNLDRFQALTGVRPVQLALPGTNARPFLEDLAADPNFKGLLIVGIADTSYFRDNIGKFEGALKAYHQEFPSQRAGYWLDYWLSGRLGFLDPDYRLSVLVKRLDLGLRPGTDGPYNQVWKLNTMGDDRQVRMWWRIEQDPRLQAHARAAWKGFKGPPVDDEVIGRTLEKTRAAVAAIRARGGDVIFVRPPSAPELRVNEEQRIPKARGWDVLLATADMKGVHADDLPGIQGLVLPEYSHLSAACAPVFTDAYVRRLTEITPRLKLRQDAPPKLAPSDCNPALAASLRPSRMGGSAAP